MHLLAATLTLAHPESITVVMAANALALVLILKAALYRVGTILEQRTKKAPAETAGMDSLKTAVRV